MTKDGDYDDHVINGGNCGDTVMCGGDYGNSGGDTVINGGCLR